MEFSRHQSGIVVTQENEDHPGKKPKPDDTTEPEDIKANRPLPFKKRMAFRHGVFSLEGEDSEDFISSSQEDLSSSPRSSQSSKFESTPAQSEKVPRRSADIKRIQQLEDSLQDCMSIINQLKLKNERSSQKLETAQGVIAELQETILKLESKNERMTAEAHQSSVLKSQIRQLQEDVKRDQDLRRELLSTIENVRTSLMDKVSELESHLHQERSTHEETKQKLLKLEHQVSTKKESFCHEDLSMFLPKFAVLLPRVVGRERMEVEPESAKEDRSILENEIKKLNQKLEEAKTEVTSQLKVVQDQFGQQGLELQDTRAHCAAHQKEILELTKKTCLQTKLKNQIRTQDYNRNRSQNDLKSLESSSLSSLEDEDQITADEDDVEMEEGVLNEHWRELLISEDFSSDNSLITKADAQSTDGKINADLTTNSLIETDW